MATCHTAGIATDRIKYSMETLVYKINQITTLFDLVAPANNADL